MTDAVSVAILATIAPTLAAVGAFWQGRRAVAKVDVVATKADAIIHKADEIHTLTNSNLTAVKADLALALKRIESLERFIATTTTTTPPPP